MEERGIHATSVQKLTGGSANFVWRAQLKEKRANLGDRPTMVIKHAEPFVAFDINLRLDAVRMNYEIAAMQTAADPVISCPKVGVPSVYSYDDQNKVVFLEDADGSADLKAYISALDKPPSTELSHEIGSLLGQFIGRLHTFGQAKRGDLQSKFDNPTGLNICKSYFYDRVESVMKSFNIDSPQAVEAAAWGGQQLATNPQTLCHGDYWTGNVLINVGSTTGVKLRIVDWEVCRYSPSGMDIGQMLAEMFNLNKFRQPCSNMMAAFLNAYTKEFHPTLYDVKIAIIHFGFHLLIWTPVTGWTEDGPAIARIGLDYVCHAWQEDWAWFDNTVFRDYVQTVTNAGTI
jgi:5-methylthioribose kinase